MNTSRCGSCRSRGVERTFVEGDGDEAYRVCAECTQRLEARALRPLEGFALAAIHDPLRFREGRSPANAGVHVTLMPGRSSPLE